MSGAVVDVDVVLEMGELVPEGTVRWIAEAAGEGGLEIEVVTSIAVKAEMRRALQRPL